METSGYTQTQPLPMPVTPLSGDHQIPVGVSSKKHSFDPRVVFILLILVGIIGGYMTGVKPVSPTTLPTPSDTPTPTPKTKIVSTIATQSAYRELTVSVASLSASLRALQTTETTLTPPTVELPLGFPNQ